ncbi:MAG: Transcriptional regulator AcuR [Cryomorphaceae bacterium]|nr:MAG: Transcriptional regulator AcuR [Cryomorphaceae bacterium]
MPIQKTDAQSIIKSALNVFLEKGYHKTSMNDLAKEAGLLKGSLYHHFASKEELMKAVIESLHEYYRREIFVIPKLPIPPLSKVKALIVASEEVFFDQRGGNFMTNIALETLNVVPDFTLMIRRFFKDWLECIAAVYREVVADKQALALARQTMAEIEGAVVMMELFDEPKYLKEAHKRIYQRYEELANQI